MIRKSVGRSLDGHDRRRSDMVRLRYGDPFVQVFNTLGFAVNVIGGTGVDERCAEPKHDR